jgi:hypothetical protein
MSQGRYYVQVGDREFGPADVETLREWRDEGRVLRDTLVRHEDSKSWITADHLAALFPDEPTEPPPLPPLLPGAGAAGLSAASILADAARCYGKRFFSFFTAALPVLPFHLATGFAGLLTQGKATTPEELRGHLEIVLPVYGVSLLIMLVLWPTTGGAITAGAMQFLMQGTTSARSMWEKTKGLRVRLILAFALTCVLYFLSVMVPATVAGILSEGFPGANRFAMIAAFGAMIWFSTKVALDTVLRDQSVVVGDTRPGPAIQESRGIMRSGAFLPVFQRPVTVATVVYLIWFALYMAASMAAAVPVAILMLSTYGPEIAAGNIPTAFTPDISHPAIIGGQIVASILVTAIFPLPNIALTLLYVRTGRVVQTQQANLTCERD